MSDKEFTEAVKKMFLKEGSMKDGKVTKSLPATKGEAQAFKKYQKDVDDTVQKMVELKYEGQRLWAGIKLRLDLFREADFQFNQELNEIEVVDVNGK